MKRVTTIILFISAISFLSLWAGEPKSVDVARHGIELAYNMQLDEAERIFDGLIARNPDDPQAYVLKSVVYYYRYLLDQSTAEIEKQFIKLAKTGIDRANKILAKDRENVDALFYAGTAHIYLAALHGEQGNWLQAFWNGKKGIQYLSRTVEIDSMYYDAYFGLGIYHYYADVMPKLVKSVTGLIGIEADRQRGLNELKMTMAKGAFAKAEAAYFLGKIYAEMEKDHEKAHACFEVLSIRYPQNPGFLLDLGESQWRNGDHHQAIVSLEAVLKLTRENHFQIFRKLAYFNLGNTYFEMERFEKAIEIYSSALALSVSTARADKWIDANALFKTAECYEKLGIREKAIDYYSRVNRSPNPEIYKMAQKRLKK